MYWFDSSIDYQTTVNAKTYPQFCENGLIPDLLAGIRVQRSSQGFRASIRNRTVR